MAANAESVGTKVRTAVAIIGVTMRVLLSFEMELFIWLTEIFCGKLQNRAKRAIYMCRFVRFVLQIRT